MKPIPGLAALVLALPLMMGCATVEKTAGGLYGSLFPSANFKPDKYEQVGFDFATSPSAADRNRHKNFKFDAFYFGVAGNVGKNEIASQHINVTLCEDAARQLCTSRVIVHDLDSKDVMALKRGAPVTFYGRVADIQSVDYGNLSVPNYDGSMNGIFLLKAHKILPR